MMIVIFPTLNIQVIIQPMMKVQQPPKMNPSHDLLGESEVRGLLINLWIRQECIFKFQMSKFQNFKMSKFQNFKISKFQNFKMSKFQNFKIQNSKTHLRPHFIPQK